MGNHDMKTMANVVYERVVKNHPDLLTYMVTEEVNGVSVWYQVWDAIDQNEWTIVHKRTVPYYNHSDHAKRQARSEALDLAVLEVQRLEARESK